MTRGNPPTPVPLFLGFLGGFVLPMWAVGFTLGSFAPLVQLALGWPWARVAIVGVFVLPLLVAAMVDPLRPRQLVSWLVLLLAPLTFYLYRRRTVREYFLARADERQVPSQGARESR